jgi:hypothetical protein
MSYVGGEPRPPASPARLIRRAERLFRLFHAFPPSRLIRATHTRRLPHLLVDLGRLRGLIYVADRGPAGTRTYVHFMRSRPRLACDPQGRQLYVLGGRYRVTARGIEG